MFNDIFKCFKRVFLDDIVWKLSFLEDSLMIIITKNTHRFRNYSVVALLTSSSLFKIKLMFGFFGLIFFIVILNSFCEIFKINDIRERSGHPLMGSAGYFFFIRLSNFTQQIIVVVIVFAIMTFDLVREVWLISKISSESLWLLTFEWHLSCKKVVAALINIMFASVDHLNLCLWTSTCLVLSRDVLFSYCWLTPSSE